MAEAKLTARQAATSTVGKYADGGGLYLIIEKSGSRAWWFIFSWKGRRPEMKLGSAATLTLAEARDAALRARRMVAAGINPIEARRAAKDGEAGRPTFGEVADSLYEAKRSEWRNAKHAEQWRQTLTKTVYSIRSLPVDEIDTASVLEVLKPIWQEKPETASRVRQRIEAVLDAARARGFRSGENPARWRGHLDHLLPRRAALARGHHAAMPYPDVPAFMAQLRGAKVVAAMALEFAILTAARSGEVYGARWSEIDVYSKVWAIPGSRMKAGRQHRVPLSDAAVEILESLMAHKLSDFVFPSPRGNGPLSHVAMAKVLRRLGVVTATVHGFRSSFRDWAGNETNFPREIAEQALAHVIGDKAEQAYRRGDALDRRRALMKAWASYCEPALASNVVKLPSAGSAY